MKECFAPVNGISILRVIYAIKRKERGERGMESSALETVYLYEAVVIK